MMLKKYNSSDSVVSENPHYTNFTSNILSSSDSMSAVEIKNKILERDWSLLESSTHPSQLLVHHIATSQCSWPNIWDHALDYGARGTTCTQALLRLLSLHPYQSNSECPVHGCSSSVNSDSGRSYPTWHHHRTLRRLSHWLLWWHCYLR